MQRKVEYQFELATAFDLLTSKKETMTEAMRRLHTYEHTEAGKLREHCIAASWPHCLPKSSATYAYTLSSGRTSAGPPITMLTW